jgi:hypothetical protein
MTFGARRTELVKGFVMPIETHDMHRAGEHESFDAELTCSLEQVERGNDVRIAQRLEGRLARRPGKMDDCVDALDGTRRKRGRREIAAQKRLARGKISNAVDIYEPQARHDLVQPRSQIARDHAGRTSEENCVPARQADIPRIPGLSSVIFCLVEALPQRNSIAIAPVRSQTVGLPAWQGRNS